MESLSLRSKTPLLFVMNFKYFLILVITLFSLRGLAQNTPQEEAQQLFEEGKYTEALPAYKRLVTLFPKDPRYQYYAGVCMVQSNTDLSKALTYLNASADKSVPRNVYFFLGKAYHYLYRFDDALVAYLKFQQFGDRVDKEKWQCDMHVAMSRNGKRLLERKVMLKVIKTETIGKDELFDYYNRLLKSGKFMEKPDRQTIFDDSKSRTTWCFMPSFLDKGQEIYQSLSGTLRRNRDLVTIKKLENNGWSKPESLGAAINTNYDEDYAYFNFAESSLYFASKGHNSMGGYDIFKSTYNPDTKTWSESVNLGFPINSPYDDFLFVPSDDQSVAWFASNRDTKGDKLNLYTIEFAKEYASTGFTTTVDYSDISHLTSSIVIAPEVKSQPVSKTNAPTAVKYKPVSSSNTEVVVKPKVTNPYPSELMEKNEYNNVLNAALQYQLQSDSLSRIAEDVRQTMQNSKSETDKARYKREIYLLEQRAKVSQQKADEFYDKARAYEVGYSENSKSATAPPTTDNLVKQAFTGKDNRKQSSEKDKKLEKQSKNKPHKDVPKPVVNEFKIMAKTPYKKPSDIPLNQPMPEGLLYRIQMGAFSKAIEADRFKGIVPICGETVQNTIVTKFYAGMFSKMADAEKALNKIREYGFRDAYIVSFYNGKSIPINRAKEMERDN